MTAALLVALGGALGASARYAMATRWTARFPWSILVANLAGSFVLGVLLHEAQRDVLLFVGVGFCGALTTFSTFALDTVVLAREGRPSAAGANIMLSAAGSITALALGLALASLTLG